MRDALNFLMAPLLVIWGAKDRIIPASHAEDLPDHVRVELFEDAGHMLHMEAAAAFNGLVRNFLRRVDGA